MIAYEIEKQDESLAGAGEAQSRAARRDTSHLYIQSALLYTTSEGERRIRVHNMAVPLTNMKHLPFEYLDVTATAHYLARLALSRLTTNVNFQVCRSTIEMYLTNLCRSMLKSQSNLSNRQLPENIQYLIMYVLGLLKMPFLSPVGPGGKALVTLESLDQISYLRYLLNNMSPEETLPLYNPWLFNIHDFNLNDQAPPAMEALDRSLLGRNQLLLCFNGLAVYIYVGRTCDPWFLNELFKVQDFAQVDRHTGEDELFAVGAYEHSAYLVALYNIINMQLRAQRQPFCEIRVLTEGDPESDTTLRSMLVNDAVANPSYNIDFAKFLATITGGSSGGATAAAGGVSG